MYYLIILIFIQFTLLFSQNIEAIKIQGNIKTKEHIILREIKQEISGIRPGEKVHETLINHDEIRYAWEINNMYMLANPHYKLFNDSEILENYDGIKKVEGINSYSSDTVEKITKEELKEKIKNSGLLD